MCCRQKSSASADSVAETSRQMCPWPPDEAAKSPSLNAVKATDGPTAVTVSACVDALCNANCAMFFGIFVGASSQINPRRVQRAHGSPGVKLQRTLDTLQALQTRAGGGMHNGLAADPGRKCRHSSIGGSFRQLRQQLRAVFGRCFMFTTCVHQPIRRTVHPRRWEGCGEKDSGMAMICGYGNSSGSKTCCRKRHTKGTDQRADQERQGRHMARRTLLGALLGACGRGSCRGFWQGGWENARPRAFGGVERNATLYRSRGTQHCTPLYMCIGQNWLATHSRSRSNLPCSRQDVHRVHHRGPGPVPWRHKPLGTNLSVDGVDNGAIQRGKGGGERLGSTRPRSLDYKFKLTAAFHRRHSSIPVPEKTGGPRQKLGCTLPAVAFSAHVERHEADALLRWRPDDA